MLETFILSMTSFVGTNIDDMIINTFFFSFAKGKRAIRKIVLGKYLGTGILILISIIGSLGLKMIPLDYVKYLGFVPICLGVKELIGGGSDDSEEDPCVADSNHSNLLWNVAVVTIANGADNIGVYVPVFTKFSMDQYLVFMVVFAFMTAIWCMIGYRASKVPFYENMINKYKMFIVPLVYFCLGLYILF